MPTNITPVQSSNISHAVFIDLQLGNTTYYISSAYSALTLDGNTYTQLGSLLSLGDIREDVKATTGDLAIAISGIPDSPDYTSIIFSTPIKGGTVKVRRGFFDTQTNEILFGQVYERYNGIITNWAFEEETDYINGELTHSIAITCASQLSILKNKIAGQRTNAADREKYYPGDISFDRVEALQNVNFDFGKEYTGGTGQTGGGGGRGGLNPQIDFNIR